MAPRGGADDTGTKKVAHEEENTIEAIRAAHVMMYMANCGHERLGRPNEDLSILPKKKHHNMIPSSHSTSRPSTPKKYRSLKDDIYGKGKEKIVYSEEVKEEKEDEEDEDESWNLEYSSDLGYHDDVSWNMEYSSDFEFYSTDEDRDMMDYNFAKNGNSSSVNREVARAAPVSHRQELGRQSPLTGMFVSLLSFLWAVRMVLITPIFSTYDGVKGETANSLTTDDVIQRVSEASGEAHLLGMKVIPLEELVIAVLNIFSSLSPPQGVSSFRWKPLAAFDESTRNWSWTGPVSYYTDASDITSPEAWGLTCTMLNKLVQSFSKIAKLPDAPIGLMQQPSYQERFESRRRNFQNSVCTIWARSQEVVEYFRKEEALRYLVPERAFEYTTCDGQKATVAPLRRCSGKPTRKRRDHFILKPNRPPCFTVLCLVRDAAARLPDAVGTRSDICSLVRDSQYIVDKGVGDDPLKQIVSGALDRLHYELDPCVKYNKDDRLWIYQHGQRFEDDFKDGCTSSIKNKKRRLS